MPEEAQSTDQQIPPKEAPKNTSHKINWLHILIGVIIGAFLLGAGFGVYFLTQSKEESTTTPAKVATPSSKQATSSSTATPSAEKDETSDWKTYEDKDAGYSIKYPPSINKGYGYGDVGFLSQFFSNYEFKENIALSACEVGTGKGKEDCFGIVTTNAPRDTDKEVNDVEVGETKKIDQVTYTRESSISQAGHEWVVFTSKFDNGGYRYTAKVVRDNKYYSIQIDSDFESTVDSNVGIVKKILSTFKFLD